MAIGILFLLLAAYLLGSVPFSHLITKWRTGLVIREVGEGNVGSRNVWHVVGPQWGALAFTLDVLKGLLVYLGGIILGVPIWGIGLAGIAAVLGHQFSFFLHWQGGKGLATILGLMLGFSPLAALGGLALMGLADLYFHNFNRSVIVGALGIIFLPLVLGQSVAVSIYALGLAMLSGVKKLLDRQHETAVWQAHPWQGNAKPGFYHEEGHEHAASQDANAH
ncbi:MAG TPA: glycerol-3-phosphate acyltransferase [Ktedonobacterales bacterium]|nr:glycerol-3-phosphate acyltransferase [Ktedonobacterales bacterium]